MTTSYPRNPRHRAVLGALAAFALGACGETGPTAPEVQTVASVTVSASSMEVEESATLQLSAVVSPSGAPQAVTWSTSDAGIAMVSGAGLVTGVATGDVTVTATSTADTLRTGSIALTVTCRNIVQSMVGDGGTIAGDTCYQVLTPLTVNTGTLVVEAGAHISFGTSGSLSIASAGRLTAVGAVDQQIVFTSLDPAAKWRGIRFDGSSSTENRFEHVVLENGGSSGWSGAAHSTSALLLEGNTRVDVVSSEIRGSGGQGLTADGDVVLDFSTNTLADNAIAAWVHPNAARSITADNVFDANADQVVRVGFGTGDAVSTAQTWAAIAVPFEIQTRMYVESPLTLDPGAHLSFAADASMIVRNGGTLTADGLPEAPIFFSGAEDLPGYWKGLQIATVSAANVFDNVVFENGGSSAWTGLGDSRAMVFLDGNSKAVFTSSTFRDSDHYALWVPAGGDITGFAGNAFEGNARTLVVHPNRAGAIASDNTFTANTEQFVRVSFGNNDGVTVGQTWSVLGVPYRVTVRTFVEAALTIEAGTVLEFAQDVSLIVSNSGSLTAVGTAQAPILFRGGEALSAYWKGLEFGTATASNVLDNVQLSHAGSEAWFGGSNSIATLFVTGDGLLDLADVTVRDTGGYALILESGGGLTCSNVDDGGFMYYDRQSMSASPICP